MALIWYDMYVILERRIVMTIQEMRDRKQELGLSNEEISRRSGVPLGTLQKILAGKTSSFPKAEDHHRP